MLPPDVKPIVLSRRETWVGVTLMVFGAFSAGTIGLVVGFLIGRGTL